MTQIHYRKLAEDPSTHTGQAYDPTSLLKAVRDRLHLPDDCALAKLLGMEEDVLEKIRDRRLRISPSMLLQMQQTTGIQLSELRMLLNDRRGTALAPWNRQNRRR